MGLQWFRVYHEMIDDPKVGTLNDSQFRLWVEILCVACESSDGGNTGMSESELSWKLRRDITPFLQELYDRNLIVKDNSGKVVVTNWEKRQFCSDSSVERTRKYRKKLKAATGSTSGYTKHAENIFKRDGNKCVYCGSSENLCIDHVLPVSMGGTDDVENLAAACKACNSGKAGRTPEGAGYTWKNKRTKEKWDKWITQRDGHKKTCDGNSDCTDTDTDIKEKFPFRFKKKVSVPKNFHTTPDMIAYAKEIGYLGIPDEHTKTMILSSRAKDYKYKDWHAAWKTWLRNAIAKNPKLKKKEKKWADV
jgi:5-methylcytosine-specific restriction endonuclease McrA